MKDFACPAGIISRPALSVYSVYAAFCNGSN